jgi:hypothetical protein
MTRTPFSVEIAVPKTGLLRLCQGSLNNYSLSSSNGIREKLSLSIKVYLV